MSECGTLPVVLRRERFGGIVFDPFDGTMLELDHDGYAVARAVLRQRGFFLDAGKRAFARELRARLHCHRLREVREIAVDPWPSATRTPTLSAPTLVDFQITDRCNMGCPHCYASAVTGGGHVPWHEIALVVEQMADCGVCQVAIGGGEPLLHPDIVDMLALCHERGIVPNLTTGGNEFDERILRALRRYCGAVGMSMEGVGADYDRWRRFGFDNFRAALARMRDHGIPTVLQITLSAANIDQLDAMVDFCLEHEHLYGVVFLAYKNVGRGTRAARGLGTLDPVRVSAALSRAFARLSPYTRVGYDCCMTPGIAGVEVANAVIDTSNLEGCSATRGSVGVSSDLEVIPCTFTGGYPLGNLREMHLRDIWQGARSEAFRQRIHRKSVENAACAGCGKRSNCLGGCPVMPLINCHRDHLAAARVPEASPS